MAIEDLVMGTGGRHLYKEANHRIYPAIGQVYVEPDNRFGRAAFYSHEKIGPDIIFLLINLIYWL